MNLEKKYIIPLTIVALILVLGFGILIYQNSQNNQLAMTTNSYLSLVGQYGVNNSDNAKASEETFVINSTGIQPEYVLEPDQDGGFCNDSDGGNFPDVYGEVSFAPNNYTLAQKFHDECIASSTMIENVCVNGFPASIPFDCPVACEGNKCVGDACIDTDGGKFPQLPGRAYILTANGTKMNTTADKCEVLKGGNAFVSESFCELDPASGKYVVKSEGNFCDQGMICKEKEYSLANEQYCDYE